MVPQDLRGLVVLADILVKMVEQDRKELLEIEDRLDHPASLGWTVLKVIPDVVERKVLVVLLDLLSQISS